jgi:hypothetical protein
MEMDALTVPRRIASALRLPAALAICAAFWLVVGPRLQFPPWVYALLPAGFLGWLLAVRRARWSAGLVAAILVGSLASTLFGQWLPDFARIGALERRARSDAAELQAQAAVAAHIARREGQPADPPTDPDTAAVRPPPGVTPWIALRISLSRMPKNWFEWFLTAAVTLAGSLQAARMTIQRANRRELNPKGLTPVIVA